MYDWLLQMLPTFAERSMYSLYVQKVLVCFGVLGTCAVQSAWLTSVYSKVFFAYESYEPLNPPQRN